MIAYAESSAVLAWLLHEPSEGAVRGVLAGAERVVASALTGLECARALARSATTGRLDLAGELAGLRLLDAASASWVTVEVTERVVERARGRFPHEPVRTLDALHLATAEFVHQAHGSLTLVSLDERLRTNAVAIGLSVAP